MKKGIFWAFMPVLLLAACRKTEHPDPVVDTGDCVSQFIKKHQLKPFTGVGDDCYFWYGLYAFGGKDWFLLDNPCTDMISIPIDCDGKQLVSSFDDPYLNEFYRNAVFQKPVGIVP